MARVEVKPELLEWALSRSHKSVGNLEKDFLKLEQWLSGELHPTMKQLESFAAKTGTPLGWLFLPEPPDEPLPIPDFRKAAGAEAGPPSANLLETLYSMQQRQNWLRETLIEEGAEPLGFVGAANLGDDPAAIAEEMRGAVGLDDGWARKVRTWTDAVGELRRAIEDIGVMAVINGVVGNNTHRKLDVDEFRGFALSDEYAPLIFVNGADFKSAQMFTLAHELAHIWLGREGVSGFEQLMPAPNDVEIFCDKAAAEFLAPAGEVRKRWADARRSGSPFEYLARHFKVGPIVAARRALALGLISKSSFFTFYNEYASREREEERRKKAKRQGGGDFYNSQNSRVGERFATEVVRAAKEGRLLYRDAYKLTGLYGAPFAEYSRRLGFDVR